MCKKFFLVLFITVFLDSFLWLWWTSSRLYEPAYRSISIRWKPNLAYAIPSWMFIALGVSTFCLSSPRDKSFRKGCIMGLAIYGTYNMTTMVVLNGFPLSVAMTDMLWGTFLCGATAAIASKILHTSQ